MRAPADSREHQYATDRAKRDAEVRGFTLTRADWRAIFLAITDGLAGETKAPPHVAASLRGLTRNNERWTVCWRGVSLDAIYDPGFAVIVRLEDGRGPIAPVIRPAPSLRHTVAAWP